MCLRHNSINSIRNILRVNLVITIEIKDNSKITIIKSLLKREKKVRTSPDLIKTSIRRKVNRNMFLKKTFKVINTKNSRLNMYRNNQTITTKIVMFPKINKIKIINT